MDEKEINILLLQIEQMSKSLEKFDTDIENFSAKVKDDGTYEIWFKLGKFQMEDIKK